MPTYDGGAFVGKALESALRQTLADFELIAVDDGSSDDTVEQIRRHRDARIRLVEGPHRGAPAAMNSARPLLRGRYVAFLDQDDLWMERKLERHAAFFESHPEVDLSFDWSDHIDAADREIGLHPRRWRGPISFRELFVDFVIGNTSSIVVRRAALERVGGLDIDLPAHPDLDFCLRVALLRPGNVHAIPERLTLYRRHPGQLSRDWPLMWEDWERMREKLRGRVPEDVAAVEGRAASNELRYLAYLAYEAESFADALRLMAQGLRRAPGAFLVDSRNWRMGAAALSAMALPASLQRGVERLGGVRRGEGGG